MINPTSLSGKLAIDVKDMNELRQAAKANSPEALKTAATQFEALFMNMMLKSMREATPQDGMFDSEQTRMYTSMLDQQLSQTMASRGIGLADALFRQLSGKVGNAPTPAADGMSSSTMDPAALGGARAPSSQPAHIKDFRDRLEPHAEEASRATGIPAKFMLGQAALESGWGRREIMEQDGSASHNLFGIKATGGWKGRVVEAATTEYVNGEPQTKVEKFRAYDSYADAFRDYANLLRSNPRYESVLANAQSAEGFAQGLQRAGYATDPNYAAKLTRIIRQSLSA
ncbi:flagellar assembly peptidoglycan hydrolase FlgJ [Noviherbaspirillum sp.]|uniref:flagellar assembly peptidoglycan hydrolase FlgJ n=1 Tax=Noviherbaspirillum sp. TaxID=1926288 RepID=UPI002B46BD3F|nr:flagellar assembly peptidoglycan hydrolase FlgJ [Noviherbaspirillum sp.]HJV79593.1 flagellar assembly peptidoglycan hydrolase FlgJ [Noviherbaspirillum sp.]